MDGTSEHRTARSRHAPPVIQRRYGQQRLPVPRRSRYGFSSRLERRVEQVDRRLKMAGREVAEPIKEAVR